MSVLCNFYFNILHHGVHYVDKMNNIYSKTVLRKDRSMEPVRGRVLLNCNACVPRSSSLCPPRSDLYPRSCVRSMSACCLIPAICLSQRECATQIWAGTHPCHITPRSLRTPVGQLNDSVRLTVLKAKSNIKCDKSRWLISYYCEVYGS
jgi:hypothetical protein